MGFTRDPEIVDLADRRSDNIYSSQADEELFRFQKNSKLLKGKRRFRRPEKAMAMPLAKRVLSKVMRYDELEVDGLLPNRCVRLAGDAFQGKDSEGTLPFKDIVSTKTTPSFYSPGAINWSQPAADLPLIQYANDSHQFKKLRNAWLSVFCQSKHRIVLVKDGVTVGFAVAHWPDRSGLVIPCSNETSSNGQR